MLLIRRIWRKHDLASSLIFAIASAIATDWIGVHALFGAFFAGAIIRKTPAFIEETRRVVEPLTMILFLPVFFAFTGLRAQIQLAWSREALLRPLAPGSVVVVDLTADAAQGMQLLGSLFSHRLDAFSIAVATAEAAGLAIRGVSKSGGAFMA